MLIKNNNYCFAWLLILSATTLVGADSAGGDLSPRSEFVSKVALLKNSPTMKPADRQELMRFSGLTFIQDDKVPSPFKTLKTEFDEAKNNLMKACLVPRMPRGPSKAECSVMEQAHKSLNDVLERIVETALKVDINELKKV